MSDLIDPDGDVKSASRTSDPAANGTRSSTKAVPSGRTRKGRCPNVGECSNGGRAVEVPAEDSFVCPECGSELLPERRGRPANRKRVLVLFVLVAALCLLGVGSYYALAPFVVGLIEGSKGSEKTVSTGGRDGPPPGGIEKTEKQPPQVEIEKKPTLAEAEAALRKELPKGITLVSLKPNEEQKAGEGSWNVAYDATVMAENDQYWVPIADMDAAHLSKRLNQVPSAERQWARRHLKDLVLTQDQAPGQEYLFSRKKPLASLAPGTPFPFAWKAVATQGEDGFWKFVPTTPLPFVAPAPSEGGADTRVVLRSSPELQQAQLLEEQRWNRFVQHLRKIEQEARARYREVMANAPAWVRKPDVFRAGSGGPTTMGEGAGIGMAGGALGGAMFGGGEGAAIGAGLGALFGALGGAVYSHQAQEKRYQAALAERKSYEQQAARAESSARTQLLNAYEQELEEQAQERLSFLAGGSPRAFHPSPAGGSANNPDGGPPAMPPFSSEGSGPPPMPPMPAQQPDGPSAPAADYPPGPDGNGSPFSAAESGGTPPPPPPPPPY